MLERITIHTFHEQCRRLEAIGCRCWGDRDMGDPEYFYIIVYATDADSKPSNYLYSVEAVSQFIAGREGAG